MGIEKWHGTFATCSGARRRSTTCSRRLVWLWTILKWIRCCCTTGTARIWRLWPSTPSTWLTRWLRPPPPPRQPASRSVNDGNPILPSSTWPPSRCSPDVCLTLTLTISLVSLLLILLLILLLLLLLLLLSVCGEFERLLQEQAPMEAYTEWIESIVDRWVLQQAQRHRIPLRKSIRQFLLTWMSFGNRLLHNLTTQNASGFGLYPTTSYMYK